MARELRYEVIDRERMGGRLTFGKGVSIARGVSIDTSADVTLDSHVAISDDVLILTHDHDPGDITRKHASPLHIHAGVWIGARSIILASCSYIGTGAVIGAGSVVTRDIPAHELWAGNPARLIRRLDG